MITTSFHSGSVLDFAHNARDARRVSSEEHIHPDIGRQWSYGVGVDGRTLADAYDEIFGEATRLYNEKQKRPERRIPSYYEKVRAEQLAGEKKLRERRGADDGKAAKSFKKTCYESIMTVGSKYNFNDCFAADHEQLAVEEAEGILTEALDRIQALNPHVRVVGVYFHADEFHEEVVGGVRQLVRGAPHLHVDWVPVADGYKRGLSLQNALDRALRLDGHESKGWSDTAQQSFQRQCVSVLDECVKARGHEVTHPIMEHKAERREHLEKADYVAAQLDSVRKELNSKQWELLMKSGEVNTATSSKEALERKIEDSKATLDELNSSMAAVQLQLAELERQRAKDTDDLAKKKRASEREFEAFKKDIEASKSKLRGEVRGLKAEKQELDDYMTEHDDADYARDLEESIGFLQDFIRTLMEFLEKTFPSVVKAIGRDKKMRSQLAEMDYHSDEWERPRDDERSR